MSTCANVLLQMSHVLAVPFAASATERAKVFGAETVDEAVEEEEDVVIVVDVEVVAVFDFMLAAAIAAAAVADAILSTAVSV